MTRLTVDHQFGSKVGLLEAVYDDLARRGRIAEELASAYQQPDPLMSLNAIVAAFVGFWSRERLVIRRLRSTAVLDPSFRGATDRDERRLAAMRNALHRLAAGRDFGVVNLDSCARVLSMLTSFEAFDPMAGPESELETILATLQGLVRAALDPAIRERGPGR